METTEESLLCSAYKIYTEVIKKRMEEVEGKRFGKNRFRRGRSTIDNIFISDHIVRKESRKKEKEGKVYTFFADLKTAFDNVNREKLWEMLENKGIKKELI